MPQRGEVAGRGVAETHPDLVPVRHVERSGEHVAAELAERVAFERGRPDRDEQHHQEHRRQEPPGPSQPEVTERDPVVALALGDQQQRDQVAGDDEEHLHAEEAAREPRVVGVVDHHRDDGERPETVEAGQVRHTTDLGAVALGDSGDPRQGGGRHRPSSITESRRNDVSQLDQVGTPSEGEPVGPVTQWVSRSCRSRRRSTGRPSISCGCRRRRSSRRRSRRRARPSRQAWRSGGSPRCRR